MNNVQILEPNKIFNYNSNDELDSFDSPSFDSVLNKSSYSFMSKDSSSTYNKKQVQQGNDTFSISEFTSTYTKRTVEKNISTLINQLSNSDLTNMNQLYSNQKQLALPYNQSNSGLANQEVVYDFMKLKNSNNLDSFIRPLEQSCYSLRSKAPYELFTNFKKTHIKQ